MVTKRVLSWAVAQKKKKRQKTVLFAGSFLGRRSRQGGQRPQEGGRLRGVAADSLCLASRSSLNIQWLAAHITPLNRFSSSPSLPNATLQLLAFHFVSAFRTTHSATRHHKHCGLHAALADTS